jgi:hypothetical protein
MRSIPLIKTSFYNNNRISLIVKYLISAIFFIFCILSLIGFWKADTQQVIDILEDDAYYYFAIARNISQGQGLTFDGKTITNGFHPLWLICILPIFMIWQDPILCLRIVGSLSICLTTVTGFLGFRYIFSHRLLVFLITSVFFIVLTISISNTGMETAILLPLSILSLIKLKKLHYRKIDYLITGSLLSLMLLARLDMILLIIVIAFVLIVERPKSIWIFTLPGLSLGFYLFFNFYLTGNIFPTSSSAKSLLSEGNMINTRFLHQLTTPNNSVDGNLWTVYAFTFIIAIGFFSILLIQSIHSKSTKTIHRYHIPCIVSCFFVVYTLYYLFGTSWVLWRWYAYPLVLFAIFILPILLDYILTRFELFPNFFKAFDKSMMILSLGLIFSTLLFSIKFGNWIQQTNASFKYFNYLSANELNQHLSYTATLAMGDRAGSLAYFFDGDVLQLEGLLGDQALIQAIKSNQLTDYMINFGVDYIATYNKPPEDYIEWILQSPLPNLTSGATADIRLCKDQQYLKYDYQITGLYLWKFPSCNNGN